MFRKSMLKKKSNLIVIRDDLTYRRIMGWQGSKDFNSKYG